MLELKNIYTEIIWAFWIEITYYLDTFIQSLLFKLTLVSLDNLYWMVSLEGSREVFIPVNSLGLLWPECIIIGGCLALLLWQPEKLKLFDINYWFFELWKFIIFIFITYIWIKSCQLWVYGGLTFFFFNQFILEDSCTMIFKIILCFCLIVTLIFTFFYSIITNNNKVKLRILFFLSFSVVFLMLLIMSFDLFGIYLCIEGLTLVLTTLISSNLTRISIESGLKYTLLSAFSSCLLLLSIGILIFFFGTTNLLSLKLLANSFILNPKLNYFFFTIHIILLKNLNYLLIFFLLNLLFKLAAWPCCFWVPDIYSGTSMPVIFFFSTTLKLIFFLFFIRFIFFTFFTYFYFLKLIFLIIAMGTTLFGVIGSLFQNKLKLFLAFSGITHIGLIFFALSSFNFIGVFSAIFYLIFYTLASFALFGLILNIQIISYHNIWGIKFFNILYLSDLKGIFFKQKFFGTILIFIFFLLSGVPPFISFFGKFWIYLTLYLEKQYYLLIILFLLSMISTFYYLWWIRSFIFDIDQKNKYLNHTCFSLEIIDKYSNKFIIEPEILIFFKNLRFFYIVFIIILFFCSFFFLVDNITILLILTKKIFLVLNEIIL